MATEAALDFVESGYDGRSHTECAELEEAVEGFRDRCGNIAVPGFTAPKLLWVKKHEPEIFRRITKVLLPKITVTLSAANSLAWLLILGTTKEVLLPCLAEASPCTSPI